MKSQWAKASEELTDISTKELEWILDGLSIHQPKAHKPVEISSYENTRH